MSVLKGNGDGTLQAAQSYDSGGCYANSVVVADANDDGNLDLLVVNGCLSSSNCLLGGGVGVLLGNGDGTFRAARFYSSGLGGAASLAVADLNGDGKLDIGVANECVFCDAGATIAALLGNGDGTFRTARIFSSGAYLAMSIAIADINLDGKPDLIVAACVPGPARCFGPSGTIFGRGVASVLLGNGDGTFRDAQTFGSGGYLAVSIVVADVNGDSKPDVLVNNECGSSNPCTGKGNVGVLLNVTGVFTSTRLRSSLNPSIYGQKVAFSATVVPSEPSTPTGQVVFKVKELTGFTFDIGRATLDSSRVATLIKSNLNADAYQVTAVYLGDTMNQGSVSPVLYQLVTETTSTAQISSSPNPSAQGQIVTFTATITSPTVTPTGPVTFSVGKQVLGTAQIVPWAHKATFATSTLPVGSTRVTATYFGNSNVARSSACSRKSYIKAVAHSRSEW